MSPALDHRSIEEIESEIRVEEADENRRQEPLFQAQAASRLEERRRRLV
jgi:hypothetical protein